jgi:hypothetical protein
MTSFRSQPDTDRAVTTCMVCGVGAARGYRVVQGVQFFKCPDCGSICADPAFIRRIEAGEVVNYNSAYWDSEIHAADERCYGSSLSRVAETLRLCRIPVHRFIDIGSGSGALLDSLARLLPELSSRFWGIEAFPPPENLRSKHPNYRIGTLADLSGTFDAGVCIEVIEHLSPDMVRGLAADLARRATPGALFYFNSSQPSFVETQDPGYLDPLGRGHIASYSVRGLAHLFNPSGFNIIRWPGRDWAFLAEYTGRQEVGRDDLFQRLWNPLPENMSNLLSARFGPLMVSMGFESARCYLEHSIVMDRPTLEPSLMKRLEPRGWWSRWMRRIR